MRFSLPPEYHSVRWWIHMVRSEVFLRKSRTDFIHAHIQAALRTHLPPVLFMFAVVYGIYWIGNLVSTCQISLTLLLIMIVSTGYGINRLAFLTLTSIEENTSS